MRDKIKALKQRILSLEASLRQHSTNDSQAPTLCVVQTNMDMTSHSKPQVQNSSPPRHSSLSNITTDRKYKIATPCVREQHHAHLVPESMVAKHTKHICQYFIIHQYSLTVSHEEQHQKRLQDIRTVIAEQITTEEERVPSYTSLWSHWL